VDSDGSAALAALKRRAPSLILADIMMPAMNGFGLLRELPTDPKTGSIPAIFLAARAGEESRASSRELTITSSPHQTLRPFSFFISSGEYCSRGCVGCCVTSPTDMSYLGVKRTCIHWKGLFTFVMLIGLCTIPLGT
jgi:CheY-like chemotaxis protein